MGSSVSPKDKSGFCACAITFQTQSKSNPIRGLHMPWGFQEVEAPRFQDKRHRMVVRLSALRTSRLYLQEIFLVLICVKKLNQPQGHSAAGRIMWTKNSTDIGDRARDLPACSAVPQPTAPPPSQYTDSLRSERSGDRIPVGSEIFRNNPDLSSDPPSLLYKV